VNLFVTSEKRQSGVIEIAPCFETEGPWTF